jgi:hypothetical protein
MSQVKGRGWGEVWAGAVLLGTLSFPGDANSAQCGVTDGGQQLPCCLFTALKPGLEESP